MLGKETRRPDASDRKPKLKEARSRESSTDGNAGVPRDAARARRTPHPRSQVSGSPYTRTRPEGPDQTRGGPSRCCPVGSRRETAGRAPGGARPGAATRRRSSRKARHGGRQPAPCPAWIPSPAQQTTSTAPLRNGAGVAAPQELRALHALLPAPPGRSDWAKRPLDGARQRCLPNDCSQSSRESRRSDYGAEHQRHSLESGTPRRAKNISFFAPVEIPSLTYCHQQKTPSF